MRVIRKANGRKFVVLNTCAVASAPLAHLLDSSLSPFAPCELPPPQLLECLQKVDTTDPGQYQEESFARDGHNDNDGWDFVDLGLPSLPSGDAPKNPPKEDADSSDDDDSEIDEKEEVKVEASVAPTEATSSSFSSSSSSSWTATSSEPLPAPPPVKEGQDFNSVMAAAAAARRGSYQERALADETVT